LKQEAQLDMMAGEDKLKAALQGIQSQNSHNIAQIVSRTELPKESLTRRSTIRYNYNSGKTGSKGASKMSIMDKIKKEARDSRTTRLGRPTHELVKSAKGVTRPPSQFVEDLQRRKAAAARPQPTITSLIRAPKPPLNAPKTDTMDREARLRALRDGRVIPSTSSAKPSFALSESFLEDDELDEPTTIPKKTVPEVVNIARTASPMKIASPQPGTLKRKQAPSLFMTAAKKAYRPATG